LKLILSRKGFDSTAGGCPSPLIDGRPVSLPIPTRMPTPTRYGDITNGIAQLVSDLTNRRITPEHPCHLDPDIDTSALPRVHGWRATFGQVGPAQSHLANNQIGAGDLFVFWGLFQPVARTGGGRWAFVGQREHRIFGWLQVDEVINVGTNPEACLTRHPWLKDHPHVYEGWSAGNTIYVARESLELPNRSSQVRGAGVLPQGHRLTRAGSPLVSTWTLPTWLNPSQGGTGLTYHRPESWLDAQTLRVASRGQEFIADIGERQDALEWVRQVLGEGGEG